MKKLFTLIVSVLAAFSANAQFNFMTEATHSVYPKEFESIKVPQNMKGNMLKAKAVTNDEPGSFEGTFVHSDWVYDDNYDYLESTCDIVFTKEEDGTYSIYNLFGLEGTIKATLNAETNQLEAEPNQVIYTHSTYGKIVLVPIYINDDYEIVGDFEAKIVFTVDGDRIMVDNDGLVLVLSEGEYAGYVLGTYHLMNQIDRVNGTLTGTNSKNEELTYNIAWDGDAVNNGYVNIYGFCNLSVVTITTDAETGLAYMENGQDVLYYDSNYGMFSTTGLTVENGQYYLADSTSGSYDVENNIIKLDTYGFANDNYTLINVMFNTVITGPSLDPIVGIDAVAFENKKQNAPVYDLMGRQTEATTKGMLYIKDGRKFIVR